jgi:hypothetical protein
MAERPEKTSKRFGSRRRATDVPEPGAHVPDDDADAVRDAIACCPIKAIRELWTEAGPSLDLHPHVESARAT